LVVQLAPSHSYFFLSFCTAAHISVRLLIVEHVGEHLQVAQCDVSGKKSQPGLRGLFGAVRGG
jgi:hypothetical protein